MNSKRAFTMMFISFLYLAFPFRAGAQLIETAAGNGVPGYAGDGASASNSEVLNPTGVAVDNSGNLYIADTNNSRIRVVNNGSGTITVANVTIAPGNIATVAGTGTPGYSGDGGLAINAEIYNPSSVAVDSAGNIYFVDLYNYRIRKVNASGIISTVTGNGNAIYSGNGVAASASVFPYDLALDSLGNIYMADTYLNAIRVVNMGATAITVANVTIPPGNIATVAGNGTYGSGGDGGPALSAQFDNPYGVAVDGQGNIYICDTYNRRVRVVNTGTSQITVANVTIQPGYIQTIAGDGTYWHRFSGPALTAEFADPDAVKVDSTGNIYISDTENSSIQLVDHKTGFITTIAGGSGVYGYNGSNIPAIAAELAYPRALAIDGQHNVYIADEYNERIFEIVANSITPSITSSPSASFVAGTPGSFVVTTNYWPTPSLAAVGTLPNGVTFTDNNDGTGTLSGTPTGGGTYSFTFTAADGVFPVVSQSFTLTIYPQGGSPVATSATLVAIDTTTQGNWNGVYGTDGQFMAGVPSPVIPYYAAITIQNETTNLWFSPNVAPPAGEPANDPRALEEPGSSSGRILATWESQSSFSFDLNLTDGNSHEISFYALDWDYRGRLETIQVQDASTGFPLYTTSTYNFVQGAYLVWNISGHVKIVVTYLGGVSASVSGVFFGGNSVSQPVITEQPQSSSVNVGATATFTVGAAGGGLSYQWESQTPGSTSFSAIAGATSSTYTTSPAGLGDSGTIFKCVVTNKIGSVTSNPATLTVAAPTSIAVAPVNPTILPGASQAMTATGAYPGGGTQNITLQVSWSSINTAVATVNSSGVVTAVGTGTSTISATLGSVSGSTLVTSPALVSIAVTPNGATILPGASQAMTATGTYAGGGTQNITSQASWGSTNTTVATVNSSGVVTALTTGTSTISATFSGISGSTQVTAPALSSISVTPSTPTVAIGGTQQFTATGTYQGGGTQNITSQVTWNSSKTAIATISSAGVATAMSAGNATISATANGISNSTNLFVPVTLPQPSGLVLYWTFDTADDTGGVALDRSGNNGNGNIYGSPAEITGKLNQALSFNGLNSFVSMPTAADPSATFINSVTLCAWINTVNASRLESIISKYDASGGGWGYIFRTDASGHLELQLGGNDIHDATSTAVDTATINDGQWHYVVAVITIGANVQFYVDGGFSSSTAIISTAGGDNFANLNVGLNQWAPFGNYFTGAIDEVRLYNRALSAVEINNLYLISGGPPLTSISVSPSNPSVAAGGTQQFTATGTYLGGATQNISSLVVWNSSNPLIATISNSGLATGQAAGNVTITATQNGLANSNLVSLTVQPPPPPVCPCTIWNNSAAPANVDSGAGLSVEVGVKFTSSSNGTITGLRFYKSSANTGTHVGNLWSSTGIMLATATFSNETASGWQQVNFSPAVAITANTVYVASYHTTVGHFSADQGFFATGVNNPPLQALSNAVGGGDGVYAYGSSSTFPGSSYNSTNYWVDVVFSQTTQAPLVSIAVTPTNDPTVNVGGTQQFTAIGGYQDNSTANLTTQVTWSSSNTTAVAINSGGLATGEAAGSSMISASLSSVNSPGESVTVAAPGCPCTIWSNSAAPTNVDSGAGPDVEVGVKFTSSSSGTITGIRFYKSSANTGTHVGNLWSSGGTLLATATFSGETASGWQQVNFSPVSIAANTVYVASYHTNVGHFSADQGFFATGVSNPPLQALSSAVAGGNGVYAYSGSSTFPSSSYNSTNYWVDVVFSQTTQAPLASIAVTPTNDPTVNVGGTQQFTATGTYQDNSTQNITTQVTWSSTNTTVATINSGGLATGQATGSSMISASLSSINSPSESLTVAASSGCPCTIWSSSTTPTVADSGAGPGVEVGVKFSSSSNGTITGIRFYKSSANTGTHVGNLWSSTGTLLATATFSGETASGWQQVNFSAPVSIAANTVYVASYHTNVGHFSADQGYFATGVSNAPLQALSNGASGGNGVYAYGAGGVFPSNSYNSTNYWVDVAFTPTVCPCSIWNGSAVPTVTDAGGGPGVEVGMKFTSNSSGMITGMSFYKSSANTGTHVGNLWSSTGTLLATATFTNETASGWQTVSFSPAVSITANTEYVVSYHTTVGHFSADQGFFATGVNNFPLQALSNGVAGGNGVYVYGAGGIFPNNSYNSTNYWVDVLFQ
jgi:uncharacterized protein YjdB